MKYIHYINIFALGTTLVLYLTIYIGMFAQITLGPLQLLLAAIITIFYQKDLDNRCKSLLFKYWVLALPAALTALITWFTHQGNIVIVSFLLFVIPMCIACYFAHVTSCINKFLSQKQ